MAEPAGDGRTARAAGRSAVDCQHNGGSDGRGYGKRAPHGERPAPGAATVPA